MILGLRLVLPKQYDLRGIWWWDSTGLDVWIIKFVHYIDLIPNVLSLNE